MGRLAVHSLETGDRQALPAGLLPAPSPSPAGTMQASKGLAAGMRSALGGDASVLLIPDHAGTCQHPRRLPQHPALVGADPNPAVEKGMI